ncbi:hypothetical protein [Sphingomonas koreensis]
MLFSWISAWRRGEWHSRAKRRAWGQAAFFVITIAGTVLAREVICSFESATVRWALLPLVPVAVIGPAIFVKAYFD